MCPLTRGLVRCRAGNSATATVRLFPTCHEMLHPALIGIEVAGDVGVVRIVAGDDLIV